MVAIPDAFVEELASNMTDKLMNFIWVPLALGLLLLVAIVGRRIAKRFSRSA